MQFTTLQKTSAWAALSKLGKAVETPQGIFFWSARAKKEAQIDGTIGVAQDDDGVISHLSLAETFVSENMKARAPKGKIFGYAPIPGIESLRKKWLDAILKNMPWLAGHASLPVVTNGITHSLALAGRLFLEPGDIICSADKSWENYEHIYGDVQGAKIVTFPLFRGQGEFDTDGLIGTLCEVAQKQKKAILLLNFPHNQTGFMPTQEQAKLLGDRLHQLIRSMPEVPFTVLLDDAYEGYVYDDKALAHSILPYIFAPIPNFTVVKLDGISKVFLAYGYRIGFVTFFVNSLDGAPFSEETLKLLRDELTSKIGGLIRAEISQAGHHGQLLADALFERQDEVEKERAKIIAMLSRRWKLMMEKLQAGYAKYGREKLWADPCNGGFFGYLNLAQGIDAKEIADRLLKEKKVGVVPGSQGLRVAFAGVPESRIAEMVDGIFEVVYGN